MKQSSESFYKYQEITKQSPQNTTEQPEIQFQLIILGDSSVGKSSFLIRFAEEQFIKNISTSMGIDFRYRSLIIDNLLIKLQIWDTAGQENYKSISKSYIQKANGVLLLFDLTDLYSFENLTNWLQQINFQTHDPNIPIILIGNKSDLLLEREVNYQDVLNFAQNHNLSYLEASAKNDHNVLQSFTSNAHIKISPESLVALKNYDIYRDQAQQKTPNSSNTLTFQQFQQQQSQLQNNYNNCGSNSSNSTQNLQQNNSNTTNTKKNIKINERQQSLYDLKKINIEANLEIDQPYLDSNNKNHSNHNNAHTHTQNHTHSLSQHTSNIGGAGGGTTAYSSSSSNTNVLMEKFKKITNGNQNIPFGNIQNLNKNFSSNIHSKIQHQLSTSGNGNFSLLSDKKLVPSTSMHQNDNNSHNYFSQKTKIKTNSFFQITPKSEKTVQLQKQEKATINSSNNNKQSQQQQQDQSIIQQNIDYQKNKQTNNSTKKNNANLNSNSNNDRQNRKTGGDSKNQNHKVGNYSFHNSSSQNNISNNSQINGRYQDENNNLNNLNHNINLNQKNNNNINKKTSSTDNIINIFQIENQNFTKELQKYIDSISSINIKSDLLKVKDFVKSLANINIPFQSSLLTLNSILQKIIEEVQSQNDKNDQEKNKIQSQLELSKQESEHIKEKLLFQIKENKKQQQILSLYQSKHLQSKTKIDKSTQTKQQSIQSTQQNFQSQQQVEALDEILKENQILKEYIVDQDRKVDIFKDKEAKMIKLLLAIKKRGIDIDQIYNVDVMNEILDESEDPQLLQEQRNQLIIENKQINNLHIIKQANSSGMADQSIINDSDESSYQFFNKQVTTDQSIIKAEYMKNFDQVLQKTQTTIKNKNIQNMLKIDIKEVQNRKVTSSSSEDEKQANNPVRNMGKKNKKKNQILHHQQYQQQQQKQYQEQLELQSLQQQKMIRIQENPNILDQLDINEDNQTFSQSQFFNQLKNLKEPEQQLPEEILNYIPISNQLTLEQLQQLSQMQSTQEQNEFLQFQKKNLSNKNNQYQQSQQQQQFQQFMISQQHQQQQQNFILHQDQIQDFNLTWHSD